jgi:hypothetical protein
MQMKCCLESTKPSQALVKSIPELQMTNLKVCIFEPTLHKKKNGHGLNELFSRLGILRCDAMQSGSSNLKDGAEGSSELLVYGITLRF